MAPPRNRRLTDADRQRIKAYTQAGISGYAIARELGCDDKQVYHYLSTQSLKPPPPVAISRSQYLLIQRFEASKFEVQELATRLDIEAIVLALELRGRKAMSSKRVQALKALFAAEPPDY